MLCDSSFHGYAAFGTGLVPDIESLVSNITLETVDLPPISVDYPFKPDAQPPGPNPVLEFEKPKLTISFDPILGMKLGPLVYSPYGVPTADDPPVISAAVVIGAASVATIVGYGVYKFFTRNRK